MQNKMDVFYKLNSFYYCFYEDVKESYRNIIFNLLKWNSFTFILTIKLVWKFCRRPFEGCFWKHIFSTGQKQVYSFKSSKLLLFVFPILTRGITQSNICSGASFAKRVAVNYFCKRSSIVDVWVGCEYASDCIHSLLIIFAWE